MAQKKNFYSLAVSFLTEPQRVCKKQLNHTVDQNSAARLQFHVNSSSLIPHFIASDNASDYVWNTSNHFDMRHVSDVTVPHWKHCCMCSWHIRKNIRENEIKTRRGSYRLICDWPQNAIHSSIRDSNRSLWGQFLSFGRMKTVNSRRGAAIEWA